MPNKRVNRIVYCAEQLLTKKTRIWANRYERACKDAETVQELDEALLIIDKRFPHLDLKEIIKDQQDQTGG